ncbi:hypothetical protein Vafri_2585 [Volvox africanus]|uniref:Uncharacterized protein n=1 Tax=Volvox africanus TaxID=51714 RepID=A0A8J4ARU8_9CHLO|nr:hypothetical protein Vafri_2585 [Volvox africanus]
MYEITVRMRGEGFGAVVYDLHRARAVSGSLFVKATHFCSLLQSISRDYIRHPPAACCRPGGLIPPAAAQVLTFTSSPTIMGEFANSSFTSCICWMIAGLVVLINGLAVYQVAYEAVVADPWVTGTVLTVLCVAYLAMVMYLAMGPQSQLSRWLHRVGCTRGWCETGEGLNVGTEAEPFLSPEERAEFGEGVGVIKADCGCCGACKCWEAGMGDRSPSKGEAEGKKDVAVKAEAVEQQKDGERGVNVLPPVSCCCGSRPLQRVRCDERAAVRAAAVDRNRRGLEAQADVVAEAEAEGCQGAGGIGAEGARVVDVNKQVVDANGIANGTGNRQANGAAVAGDTTDCQGCNGCREGGA